MSNEYPYDSRTPNNGVRVLPAPGQRNHVSISQAKAARTPETNHKGELLGVLRPVMKGGATTVGMLSTVRSAAHASPIKATHSKIKGSRRRGHSHMGSNRAFAAPILSRSAYAERDQRMAKQIRIRKAQQWYDSAQSMLKFLLEWHAGLISKAGMVNDSYIKHRATQLRKYPHIKAELTRIEGEHLKTYAKVVNRVTRAVPSVQRPKSVPTAQRSVGHTPIGRQVDGLGAGWKLLAGAY